VKSSVLLAALAADGVTTVREPALSRDHTERLLEALDAPIVRSRTEGGGHEITIQGFEPPPFGIDVPGDASAAAFPVAAALLSGLVRIEGVGLNATRTGFLEAFARMGGAVESVVEREAMGEPVGTIAAQRSELRGIEIERAGPEIHDELPLVAVLATQAEGQTVVRGAAELRVKESDRIAVVVSALRALGAEADELDDGFVVRGPAALRGTRVDPAGDHRVAMALAVAALVAEGETLVDGFECAAVSWPGFERVLASLGADVELRP
jgi:3-phosphoshikimate 1-carboxyvinyltransferase